MKEIVMKALNTVLNQKKEVLMGLIASAFSTVLIYYVLLLLSGFLLMTAFFIPPYNLLTAVGLFMASFLTFLTLPRSDSNDTSSNPR